MASFLLPSSIQKRLLRYALSRLELLDTDALDLEHLDISWGSKSTLEFRDVGLRLNKAVKLLQLPPRFDLTKARILLLRLTIPVDIYSSPILVEVDGVVGHLKILPDIIDDEPKSGSPSQQERQLRRQSEKPPRSPQPVGGTTYHELDRAVEDGLPTAVDLAESFLQTEPPEEKAELEAAISSQSQVLAHSVASSDDGQEDLGMGTGTALSLPSFMANFLKGIVDRLQIKIRSITLNLDVDLPGDESLKSELSLPTDAVMLQLSIDDLDIEGVTTELDKKEEASEGKPETIRLALKQGKRLVTLRSLRGALISEANLFTSLARSSALSSPTTAHSVVPERFKVQDMSAPASPHMQDHSASINPLGDSSLRSDNGRFDDAVEDEGIDTGYDGHESELGESVFDSSAYLDQVIDSRFPEEEEGEEDEESPGSAFTGETRFSARWRSPLSTPRALGYLPSSPLPSPSHSAHHLTSPQGPQASLQSTILPPRHRPRFFETRISRSQPLPSPEELDTRDNQREEPISQKSSSESRPQPETPGHASRGSTPMGEDLAESQLFSHEDAESMYMSAMSQPSSSRMPGAWDRNPEERLPNDTLPEVASYGQSQEGILTDEAVDRPRTPTGDLNDIHLTDTVESVSAIADLIDEPAADSLVASERSISNPGSSAPPTVANSSVQSVTSDERAKVLKNLFTLDQIGLYLPGDMTSPAVPDIPAPAESLLFASNFGSASEAIHSVSPNMPGAFSMHSPRISPGSPRLERKPAEVSSSQRNDSSNVIEIVMGKFDAQFDVSITKLVMKLVQIVTEALKSEVPSSSSNDRKPTPPFSLQFKAERISLKFLERLNPVAWKSESVASSTAWTKPPSNDILLRTSLRGLNVNLDSAQGSSTTAITLQKFLFRYAKEHILSFDADLHLQSSVRDLKSSAGVDLVLHIHQTRESTRVNMTTLPVHIAIDLQRLDETFSWFGGLNGVLNMGSSIASNTTVTESPTKPKSRSVRFDAPIRPEDKSVSLQNKINARIGGCVLDLVGRNCGIAIDTTALKMVSREEGVGLSVDKIKISGPHIHELNDEPAILGEIAGIRIEYLPTPKDADLSRLLSLITPSKSKYDQDDDILLDTLLRQRRQGAVLRLTVDTTKIQIGKLDQLCHLPELGEEIARLSTVAKYLPDDDRPSLLSLILIRNMDIQTDVNEVIGTLRLRAADIEVAQITLPSLVAFSVSSAVAHRNGSEELLGAATDYNSREAKRPFPAIMARMIGDEMEPVIKVKLWNLRVEYRVPTIMAMLGLANGATTEEMAAGIAASVATLTDRKRVDIPSGLGDGRDTTKVVKNTDIKAMAIDIVFRDCVLGLNPLGLPSKLLFVATEAHLSLSLPKDNHSSALSEMHKGTLLIVDDVLTIVPSNVGKRTRRQSFDGGSMQVAEFCAIGYVPISYISSAKVVVQITASDDPMDKHVDIELRDDLLVLESCADSTQTLFATLGGLAPPMPPSQEIKYRTKVVPVEDLLASLSGDAFGTAEGNYDFDEDFGADFVAPHEEEEEITDLDFISHYYQEAENEEDDDDHDVGPSDSMEGSLLFDQQLLDHDPNDGVLLESFTQKQENPEVEELDFQEEHFGTGSVLEGTAHRWNSAKNTYDKSNEHKIRDSPLKICVRNVHIIWNLFDGYDWQRTRDTISKAVQDVESKAIERRARNDRRTTFDQDVDDEETVIGDFLFNSIYIGIPANHDPQELAQAINQELNDNTADSESVTTTTMSASPSRQGQTARAKNKLLKLQRSKHHKITFELKGVNVDVVAFPPGSGETQSSVDVRVHDFDIFDHVPTSTWKKFATYMHDAGERETGASQVHIELLNVKPIPELAASEIVLRATVLPLRLHVDQDALDFITRFFEFKDDSIPKDSSGGDTPFLQRVEVNAIPVKLDFKPKRVDYAGLRSGHTTEFMNFIVLEEANMVLRHTIIYGISGFDRLGKTLNDIWMPDIKRTQLPGVLAGLAPVRSLANVGGGVRDLVVIPMREYKKDGRVMRSIRKGATALAKTTGTELIKLGAKLAIGTQTVLQGTEEFLTKQPEGPEMGWEQEELDEEEKKQISLYADQPVGVVQGLRGGYASLERDLVLARDAIIAVPGEVMESTNAQDAAKAVLKRAPTVILRPVIGASKAIGQTLMGATNSLDPQNRRRIEDKYKRH